MALIHEVAPTKRIMKMLADCRIFVSTNALKKVSGSVADIIYIAYKMINNALVIEN